MSPLRLIEKALIDSGYTKVDDELDVEECSHTYSIMNSPNENYIFLWYNEESIMFDKLTEKLC